MDLSNLKPAKGSVRRRKRIGRGQGSGHGGTSTRGHKGQQSRSGYSRKIGFEGGQMPLQRRLPKRGFTNIFKKEYALINLNVLSRFDPETILDLEALKKAGLVKRAKDRVKILGDGEISNPLVVKVNKVSKTARAKIEAAGGKVEIL